MQAFEEDGTAIVEVAGEIDISSVDLLETVLRTLIAGDARRVEIDLSRVLFLDSAGLRAILRARQRLSDQGRWLVTRGATGQPRRLLDIGRVQYGVIF